MKNFEVRNEFCELINSFAIDKSHATFETNLDSLFQFMPISYTMPEVSHKLIHVLTPITHPAGGGVICSILPFNGEGANESITIVHSVG